MQCKYAQKQLRAFSLGELSVDIRQMVNEHLSGCVACRLKLAAVDDVAGVLAAAKMPPIPVGFSARVLAMARQRRNAEVAETWNLMHWWRLTSAPMHAAAAAALVIGLAVGLLMGQASAPLPSHSVGQKQPDPADAYPLDYFGAAPGDSLAANYFALAATTTE